MDGAPLIRPGETLAPKLRPMALAAVGDATDAGTFSGTPFHCLQAARAAGLPMRGLRLDPARPGMRRRRAVWNLLQIARSGRPGGFQYAESFQAALWRQDPPQPEEAVVCMFQLVPEAVLARPGPTWFYVDQTLSQLFDGYGLSGRLSGTVRRDAISRERAQYHRAAGVIGHSAWAARDVVERYGVPQERVHVVLPGANLPAAALAEWDGRAGSPAAQGALSLLFIGKEWKRKGLDRLVRACGIARARGADVTVTAMGLSREKLPDDIARAPFLDTAGFVDKATEMPRFMEILSQADVGCLLSSAEAGGISLREFARLGLPVFAPDVGGAPEYAPPGSTELIAPDASDAEIADRIVRLAGDRGLLQARRDIARAARMDADWSSAIDQLRRIIGVT